MKVARYCSYLGDYGCEFIVLSDLTSATVCCYDRGGSAIAAYVCGCGLLLVYCC